MPCALTVPSVERVPDANLSQSCHAKACTYPLQSPQVMNPAPRHSLNTHAQGNKGLGFCCVFHTVGRCAPVDVGHFRVDQLSVKGQKNSQTGRRITSGHIKQHTD